MNEAIRAESVQTSSRRLRLVVVVGSTIITLFAVVVIGANLIDYLSYRRAVELFDRLGVDQLLQFKEGFKLIATSMEYQRYDKPNIPAPFKFLDPVRVSSHGNFGDLTLYETGNNSVSLHCDLSPTLQKIISYNTADATTHAKTLWTSDPALFEKLNPTNRIVTISQFRYLNQGTQWIVVKDAILVVRNSGEEEELLSRVALSAGGLHKIETALTDLTSNVRGRRYTSGTIDGIELRVIFSPDGKEQDDDIELANTWRQEVGPLLNTISSYLEKDLRIDFESAAKRQEAEHTRYQTMKTWKEIEKENDLERMHMPYPWNGQWYRWFPHANRR